MIEPLLKQTQESLQYFFQHFEMGDFQRALKRICEVKGHIFFTGVGKSGFIAQKIAQTFTSMSFQSHFLSPIDALHGDLGSVTPSDTLFILSKSGESDELLSLLPFLRNKGAFLIAVVCNEKSRLAKACDDRVYLPLRRELCPFNIAPTTSCEIQLIFGDLLAVAFMQAKKVTLEEFAENHPAGRIGKRLSLKVKDLMLTGKKLPIAKPQEPLVEVLIELTDKRCGCLLIIDNEDRLLGIFTDGDLRRALQKEGGAVLERTVDEFMSARPKQIHPESMALEAMQLMEADQKHPITVLPVTLENKLVGLIRMHDILQSGL